MRSCTEAHSSQSSAVDLFQFTNSQRVSRQNNCSWKTSLHGMFAPWLSRKGLVAVFRYDHVRIDLRLVPAIDLARAVICRPNPLRNACEGKFDHFSTVSRCACWGLPSIHVTDYVSLTTVFTKCECLREQSDAFPLSRPWIFALTQKPWPESTYPKMGKFVERQGRARLEP